MNKIVVGAAPSPNLMSAQSRIGSLANNKHKVGHDCHLVRYLHTERDKNQSEIIFPHF